MDAKQRQLSRLLKRYDPDLFPKRLLDGTLSIMRTKRVFDLYRYTQERKCLWIAKDVEDVVLPCTDTWVETGTPVDWGIEPIYWQLQKLDSWRDDGDYDRFCATREQLKENRLRAFKNEIRARAADLRKDFAKATNDINTSSINTQKKEKRSIHNGYRR